MMTKKITTLLAILCITFTINAQVTTPQLSPGAKFEQTVGLTDVSVEYSRPSMRGRVIFGSLVPYGKLWRTGANSRTKITFSDDVTINDSALKAGTYAIFSIPNKSSWEVIFYTDSKGGGAPATLDESKIALRTSVDTQKLSTSKESFSIGISDLSNDAASLYIAWEKTKVALTIGVPSDAIAMESIKATMEGPSADDYYQAAVYYLNAGKNLRQAKSWIDKAIEMKSNPAFWYLRQQSLIYAGLGDKEGAVKAAKQSLALAEKAGNADYVKMNTESINEWSK